MMTTTHARPTCFVEPAHPATTHVTIEYKGETESFDCCPEHFAFQKPTGATVNTVKILERVHRSDVALAFKNLRAAGWTARMNFRCCSSCGWYEIGENANALFFHSQDNESFDAQGYLVDDLYLAWRGDAAQAVEILRSAGLHVSHDGDESKRICIVAPEVTK